MKFPWDLSVQYLKGVGAKVGALLAKGGVESFWDLLLLLPRDYEDRRKIHSYSEILERAGRQESVIGFGRIESFQYRKAGRMGRKLIEAQVRLNSPKDPPGATIFFVWFNDFKGSLQKRFPVGSDVVFQGRIQGFGRRLQIVHPELQKSDKELPRWENGGWIPVYRELSGLSTRYIRKVVYQALKKQEFEELPEILPQLLREKYKLPSFKESIRELHFPQKLKLEKQEEIFKSPYFKRVAFDELLMMFLALHFRHQKWDKKVKESKDRIPKIARSEDLLKSELSRLPFTLTSAQSETLEEILEDLELKHSQAPMHRLLQGDVGSGKTIVAFLSMIQASEAGFQSVLMAPTEILADQHYRNFAKFFPERAPFCRLLKGALSVKEKKEIRKSFADGGCRFIIGTQALLTDDTLFENLALVIVDEQHRFGVEQRLSLKKQDNRWMPHLLVMTATPIPRSLALTLYADLSLSQIREKPPGRTPVETHLIKETALSSLKIRLKKFLDEGRQIYLVYPLVEESEELELKDVKSAFSEWTKELAPKHKVSLLHGRLRAKEKDAVMKSFISGETQVLVSTTVIEVGVDVANASVIVVFHAERFGLSQLHQLRGRVGRGADKSYCVLVAPKKMGALVEERLQALVETDDGFAIAEKDLKIRGPGEFLGRRQSGLPGFRVAHIMRDIETLEFARFEAEEILKTDPQLQADQHKNLKLMLGQWWSGRFELTQSG